MSGKKTTERLSVWRGGLILAVLAAICTALVATTHRVTATRIAKNEQEYLEQRLRPVLATLDYDANLSPSVMTIEPPHTLPGSGPVTVYRVFNDNTPVAALFIVTATDGFTGPIRLLVGIGADGVVSGVRVLEHRETPGLGDLIEASKSDWIHQFAGRSLAQPAPERWAIRRDGGEFDQLTGASITPRAVIKAIRDTLIYFDAHREALFSRATDTSDEEAT